MSNVLETPLTHDELAQSMIFDLRQVARRTEGFKFIPLERRKKLTPVAALSDEFLDVVASAFDAVPDLASACKMTGPEVRNIVAKSRAIESVAKEEDLMARGHRDTATELRSEAGKAGLRAYELAKRMNAADDNEEVVPYIAAMRETLGRRGPKKLTPEEKAKLRETRAAMKAARAAKAAATAAVEAPKEPWS